MRSAGVQSRMSHSAISTFIDSRSGLSVTSRYTCDADSSTPRSRSSGTSSVVFHISWAAISRRRFQRKSSVRRAITAPLSRVRRRRRGRPGWTGPAPPAASGCGNLTTPTCTAPWWRRSSGPPAAALSLARKTHIALTSDFALWKVSLTLASPLGMSGGASSDRCGSVARPCRWMKGCSFGGLAGPRSNSCYVGEHSGGFRGSMFNQVPDMGVVLVDVVSPDPVSGVSPMRHLVPDSDVFIELFGCPMRVHHGPVPALRDFLNAECIVKQVVDLLRLRGVELAVALLLQPLEPANQD